MEAGLTLVCRQCRRHSKPCCGLSVAANDENCLRSISRDISRSGANRSLLPPILLTARTDSAAARPHGCPSPVLPYEWYYTPQPALSPHQGFLKSWPMKSAGSARIRLVARRPADNRCANWRCSLAVFRFRKKKEPAPAAAWLAGPKLPPRRAHPDSTDSKSFPGTTISPRMLTAPFSAQFRPAAVDAC